MRYTRREDLTRCLGHGIFSNVSSIYDFMRGMTCFFCVYNHPKHLVCVIRQQEHDIYPSPLQNPNSFETTLTIAVVPLRLRLDMLSSEINEFIDVVVYMYITLMQSVTVTN